MAVIYIEDEIRRRPKRKKRALLADSSFVIGVLMPRLKNRRAFRRYYQGLRRGFDFYVNLNVAQEFLSFSRQHLIIQWAKRRRLVRKNASFYKQQLKGKILNRLGRKRSAELARYLKKHLTGAHRELKRKFRFDRGASAYNLNLDQVSDLMQRYLLDSNDAMIANYVMRSGKYQGLVTNDSDFIRLKGVMNVYVPRALRPRRSRRRPRRRRRK